MLVKCNYWCEGDKDGKRHREREIERHLETDRESARWRDRQEEKERETKSETKRWRKMERWRQMERERQAEKETGRETQSTHIRQRERERERLNHICPYLISEGRTEESVLFFITRKREGLINSHIDMGMGRGEVGKGVEQVTTVPICHPLVK